MRPANFGSLALVVTAFSTASLLADSGTDNAATWLLSRADDDDRLQLSGTLLTLRACLTSVAALVLLLTIPHFLHEALVWPFIALALVASLLTARNSVNRLLRRVSGLGEPRILFLEKGCSGACFVASALVLPPAAVVQQWAFASATLLGALVATRGFGLSFHGLWRNLRKILYFAAPFTVTAITAAIIWRLPILVLSHIGDIAAAGRMSLAIYPVQLAATVPVMGAPLILANLAGGDHRRTLRATALFGAGVSMAGMALSATFVALDLLPAVSRTTLWDVFLLSSGLVFLSCNPVLVATLRSVGSTWRPVLANAAGGVVAVSAVWAFTMPWHDPGASAGITMAEAATTVGLYILLRRQSLLASPTRNRRTRVAP